MLDLLLRADSVVLLHAMADVLSPLEASRKLFESTGCKLCDLRGEVTVLKGKLNSGDQCHISADIRLREHGHAQIRAQRPGHHQQTHSIEVDSAFMDCVTACKLPPR